MGIIVKSNIRNHVQMNVGEDVAEELDKKVEEMLKGAEKRAAANQRKTIYARDL